MLGKAYDRLSSVIQRTLGDLTGEETVELAKLVVRELNEEDQVAIHDYIEALQE